MKNYIKTQYTGNENGWGEPTKELGNTHLSVEQAAELNSHFRNTGIRYEPGTMKKEPVTTNEADHGEQNLVVKDGKQVVTKNKPKDKKVDKTDKPVTEPAKDAKPSDTTFVRSDDHIEDAIDQKAADKINTVAGTAGNQ